MIETERLILYPLSYEELGLLIESKPEMLGDISLTDLSEEDIPRKPIAIKQVKMAALPAEEHVWCTYFMMVEKGSRRAAGLLGFKGAPEEGEAEVGYGTAESFRGRGYMTEALAGLIAWAVGTGRCGRVIADTHWDNAASQKVLEKCGLTRIGETGEMVHFEKVLG